MTTPATPPAIPNVWVVTCKGGCGSYDIVGPGHPGVRFNEESGQHEFHDRDSLRHNHKDSCVKHPEDGYSLDFSFMPRPAGLPDFTGA